MQFNSFLKMSGIKIHLHFIRASPDSPSREGRTAGGKREGVEGGGGAVDPDICFYLCRNADPREGGLVAVTVVNEFPAIKIENQAADASGRRRRGMDDVVKKVTAKYRVISDPAEWMGRIKARQGAKSPVYGPGEALRDARRVAGKSRRETSNRTFT